VSTSHRVEGIVTSNGESDQTVMICYDKDSGDYVGLKFTWDDDCGKVEIIQNGAAIKTMESIRFTPGSDYQFCFQQSGGFAYAWIKSYNFGTCLPEGVGRHTLVLQAELPDPVTGVWCGVKTGTWVSPTVVADFYDLIFYTARDEEFPGCETCSECYIVGGPDEDGCEYTGLTTSDSSGLVVGETATLEWASLDEPNVSVGFSIECVAYGQSATFTLGPHSMVITASSAPLADDGTITTSEGDTIEDLGIEPGGANGRLSGMAGKICVDGRTVRFRSGYDLASFYVSTSPGWTNTATTSHTGPDPALWGQMEVQFKACDPCGTLCDACDNGYLPELAVVDASFDTGNECCDLFEGLHYIDMDGCAGVGDLMQELCGFPAPLSTVEMNARWSVDLQQFVGYVRITARLSVQYIAESGNTGGTYEWRVNVPTIGPAGPVPGVINCLTLGRLRLDFYEQTYTNPCATDGVSVYSGTHIFLEIS
jgi:hypothetical protein